MYSLMYAKNKKILSDVEQYIFGVSISKKKQIHICISINKIHKTLPNTLIHCKSPKIWSTMSNYTF